jgi:hypothetical protein
MRLSGFFHNWGPHRQAFVCELEVKATLHGSGHGTETLSLLKPAICLNLLRLRGQPWLKYKVLRLMRRGQSFFR